MCGSYSGVNSREADAAGAEGACVWGQGTLEVIREERRWAELCGPLRELQLLLSSSVSSKELL